MDKSKYVQIPDFVFKGLVEFLQDHPEIKDEYIQDFPVVLNLGGILENQMCYLDKNGYEIYWNDPDRFKDKIRFRLKDLFFNQKDIERLIAK